MFWEDEWAFAIIGLSKAIHFVHVAKLQIEVPRVKAQRRLQRQSENLKRNRLRERARIQADIDKYITAERICARVMKIMADQQATLQWLIANYGFRGGSAGSPLLQAVLEPALRPGPDGKGYGPGFDIADIGSMTKDTGDYAWKRFEKEAGT